MNNEEIRKRLSQAVADATPDVLEGILLSCEQRKGDDFVVHVQEENILYNGTNGNGAVKPEALDKWVCGCCCGVDAGCVFADWLSNVFCG